MRPDKQIPFDAEALKQKLLSQDITADDFLNTLFQNDQSGDMWTGCFENIKLLEALDVRNVLVEKQEDAYLNILSITYFHMGRGIAIKDENDAEAIGYFRKALEVAQKRISDNAFNVQEWIPYIQGTISFLENNVQQLEEYAEAVTDEANKRVLNKLIVWLKGGNEPNYKKALSS